MMKALLLFKTKNSNKGFTLIEAIAAMAIMAIFSGALYTLFFSGGKTFQVVHDSYKAQNDARIAMSYITVKIRQNDMVTIGGSGPEHAVQIIDDEHLRIRDADDVNYWWIYRVDKELRESKDGISLTTTNSAVIADIEDVTFAPEISAETGAQSIRITIDYLDGATPRVLEETVTLRSEP